MHLIEKFDQHAQHRNKLRVLAKRAGEWAGLPMGLEGQKLVVHPSYRWAHVFNPEPQTRAQARGSSDIRVRNVLWSKRFRCDVVIYQRPDGMCEAQPLRGSGNSVDMEMNTMACSVAWGIEQESNALKLLAKLVKHHQMEYYLLSGQFLESSRRSGVTYMFRKLRPTIAMKENQITHRMQILACLCLHPIAYYSGSWAGAMCPTDDVIAHLMMMRGDEPRYWKDANQIPAGRPNSGIGVG